MKPGTAVFLRCKGKKEWKISKKTLGCRKFLSFFEMKDRRLLGAADINFMLCRGAGAR